MRQGRWKNLKWSVIDYEAYIGRVKTNIKRTVKWALGNCYRCKFINADDHVGGIDAILLFVSI